jgi:hypothetical protein
MQVQELGLAVAYKVNDEVRLFCGMIDGLAFLPLADVQEGMRYLRCHVPQVEGMEDLLDYFDVTYVTGQLRSRTATAGSDTCPTLTLRRSPPLFPPPVWNVHDATLEGDERTNNVCEGWNNAFTNLIGNNSASLWTVINGFRMDEALAAADILQNARGMPPTKRVKRATKQQQVRLYNLCGDRRDGRKNVAETLRGLGHCIGLCK